MRPRAPLPFPFPLHVGTDICQISRIRAILAGPRGPRFVRRILAEEELARPRRHVAAILSGDFHLGSRPKGETGPGGKEEEETTKGPQDQGGLKQETDGRGDGGETAACLREAAVFLAGRCRDSFAAKEAVFKAHPHRRLTWHDIVIFNQASKSSSSGDAGGSSFSAGSRQPLFGAVTHGSTPEEDRGVPGDAAAAAAAAGESGPPAALIKGVEVVDDDGGEKRGKGGGDGNGLRDEASRRDRDMSIDDQIALVSISHDGDYATAVCVGFDPGRAGNYNMRNI